MLFAFVGWNSELSSVPPPRMPFWGWLGLWSPWQHYPIICLKTLSPTLPCIFSALGRKGRLLATSRQMRPFLFRICHVSKAVVQGQIFPVSCSSKWNWMPTLVFSSVMLHESLQSGRAPVIFHMSKIPILMNSTQTWDNANHALINLHQICRTCSAFPPCSCWFQRLIYSDVATFVRKDLWHSIYKMTPLCVRKMQGKRRVTQQESWQRK